MKKVLPIILVVFGLGVFFLWQQMESLKIKDQAQAKIVVPTTTANSQPLPTKVAEQTENLTLANGQISLSADVFNDNKARFYNVNVSGKTINFFVVKDKNGVYRAAANACQVCFAAKQGFRQEGNEMVCNTCGNRYSLEKIATEKGGCNPAPISPNIKVVNGQLIILETELSQVSQYF